MYQDEKTITIDVEMAKVIIYALCRDDYEGSSYVSEATRKIVEALHLAFPEVIDRDVL